MTLFSLAVAFVLGAAIGSFCNVVIYRLHVGDSPTRGRSYCPHCKHELAAADLIPILSFVLLRGKCRYCRQPISWQYPGVELAMAGLSLLMVQRFDLTVAAAFGIVLSAFFVIIFVYDLKYQLILDRVSIPAAVVGLAGSLVIGRSIGAVLLGGLIGGGFFLLQYLLSKGRWIGGGDIRLGAALGFALGWPLVGVGLVLSYLIGAVVALPLLAAKKSSWTSLLPFGTFLTVAGLVTFLYGDAILHWYLRGGFFDFVVSLLPEPQL